MTTFAKSLDDLTTLTIYMEVMKKFISDMLVTAVERYANGYSLLRLTPKDGTLPPIEAGQFVQVRIDDTPGVMLRRPISVNFVDRKQGELWLLVHSIGTGTQWLTNRMPGQTINLVFPLGKGFSLISSSPSLLVGGGVGTAPLLYLASKLHEQGQQVYALLGARSAADVLQRELFEQYATVCITTEDGSSGERGLVTQHSIWNQQQFARIYTCGPKPMMKAVAQMAHKLGVSCEASLENMMACGLGACLCCVEDTRNGNLCVCKEGPVFNTDELKW